MFFNLLEHDLNHPTLSTTHSELFPQDMWSAWLTSLKMITNTSCLANYFSPYPKRFHSVQFGFIFFINNYNQTRNRWKAHFYFDLQWEFERSIHCRLTNHNLSSQLFFFLKLVYTFCRHLLFCFFLFVHPDLIHLTVDVSVKDAWPQIKMHVWRTFLFVRMC